MLWVRHHVSNEIRRRVYISFRLWNPSCVLPRSKSAVHHKNNYKFNVVLWKANFPMYRGIKVSSGNQDIYKSAENCMESLYTSNVYNRYSSCVKLVILRKNVSIFNSMGQKVTLKCNIMSYNGLIYTASSHLWFDGLKYVSMRSFISRVKQYVWYVSHYLDWGFFYCHILGHR